MRNCFLITVMAVAVAIACSGDDDSSSSPLQPSPLTTPAGAGPRGFAGGPPAGADAAGAGIAQLAPPPDDFNAYNAQIEYMDGEVTITFVPVDMSRMPPAAGAHRNRAVTVRHCPVEPHHVGQVCGDGAPVFQDSFAFMGSPSRTFAMPECSGWLVIEAAELSDDRYDGWRSAPLSCRTDDQGRAVASVDTDGNGDGWDGSRYDPPARAESEADRVERVVDEAIADAADRFVPGTDPVSVSVTELFEDTGGTEGDDYRATSSDPAVATVEVTPDRRVKITPVGPGTTTIRVSNLMSEERVEFGVTVEKPGNRPPAITNPGSKAYAPGQEIEAFRIAVTDADGDTVTVGVEGLPTGLTYSSETKRVSGTVAADAAQRAYPVTVTADDGTSDPVTATFTITIAVGNVPPTITNPGSKAYVPGQMIEAFRIAVTDPNDDDLTVTVEGLPDGLTWSSDTSMVSGTVAATNAAVEDYTVTVTANDGVNDAVTATFTITVTNSPPTITNPGNKAYAQRETIEAFRIAVTDPDGDDVRVTVDGLPTGLAWSSETKMVSGTVAFTVAAQAYPVTVTANDGVNEDDATETFTITIEAQTPPSITAPEDATYMQGVAIEAFRVPVTDANSRDEVMVTVTGLPMGLTYSPETGMVSGTVALGATAQDYTVTVTANDGVNEDDVTATFTITVNYQTTRLYDANGPYTFLRVQGGNTVNRIHIAFLMLNRTGCPASGTNVRYGGVGRLRGSGTTVLEFAWNNIGPAPWTRGSSYARITNPESAGASLSVYRFRGGPARIASEVFPSMAYDLISPVKDPQGLAPSSTKTRVAVPPHSSAGSYTFYVTDSVDVTLTIDPTTSQGPGGDTNFTPPTDGSYCLVEMATCSATGTVFC